MYFDCLPSVSLVGQLHTGEVGLSVGDVVSGHCVVMGQGVHLHPQCSM